MPRSLGAAWLLGTEDPPCLSPPAHLWGGDSDDAGGSTCTGSLRPGHEEAPSTAVNHLPWTALLPVCLCPDPPDSMPCCCLGPEVKRPDLPTPGALCFRLIKRPRSGLCACDEPTGPQAQDREGPLLPTSGGSGSRSRSTSFSPGPGMCPCAHLQGLQP